jgi:hypothetical protein
LARRGGWQPHKGVASKSAGKFLRTLAAGETRVIARSRNLDRARSAVASGWSHSPIRQTNSESVKASRLSTAA